MFGNVSERLTHSPGKTELIVERNPSGVIHMPVSYNNILDRNFFHFLTTIPLVVFLFRVHIKREGNRNPFICVKQFVITHKHLSSTDKAAINPPGKKLNMTSLTVCSFLLLLNYSTDV